MTRPRKPPTLTLEERAAKIVLKYYGPNYVALANPALRLGLIKSALAHLRAAVRAERKACAELLVQRARVCLAERDHYARCSKLDHQEAADQEAQVCRRMADRIKRRPKP